MAGRARRPAARTAPVPGDDPAREVNLSGFSDEELAKIAEERDIELPADADRDTVIATMTSAIAEQEAAAAAEAAAAGNAGDTPPDAAATDEAPRARRRRPRSDDQPTATRDLIHAGRIIPAGEQLPEDFPEGDLPTLFARGQVE